MTVQPPLFLPGWDKEPCDTAPAPDPDEQAHADVHARRQYTIPPDIGRPAGRADWRGIGLRPIADIPTGSYL